MRENVIEDAVNAVMTVNKILRYQAYALNIYGQEDCGRQSGSMRCRINFHLMVGMEGCFRLRKVLNF